MSLFGCRSYSGRLYIYGRLRIWYLLEFEHSEHQIDVADMQVLLLEAYFYLSYLRLLVLSFFRHTSYY